MSAEPRQTTSTDAWTTWPNQVVQGRFALRRLLGWTDHSAVFLTEHKAKNLPDAAIKFVRVDAPQAQTLLLRWQAAINLSHPHLVQLFELGTHELGGRVYQFVVMEYGDQTLAEILRRRPLSGEELQELLPPVLEALTFLHRRELVHGQLKPSNFLAVGDELKLAADTIRPAGQDRGTSTAGDVWNLGATLVEAITARARIANDQPFDVTSLPGGLPTSLVDTLQRCLSVSPAARPSIIELRAEHKPGAQQKVSQEVAAPSRPAETVSRGVSPIVPAPSAARETAPRPTPAPAPPQTAETPLRVAIPNQPIPVSPRESAPLKPVQTASRVTVSFHAVPSPSQEDARPKPAPSISPNIPPPSVANAKPSAAVPASPAPSVRREAAADRAANNAPHVATPSSHASITSREVARPQPTPSTSQDVTPPKRAAREVTSQPTPNIFKAAVPPKAASTSSRESSASQSPPKRNLSILGIAAGALLLIVAVWIGWRSAGNSPAPVRPAAVPAPAPIAPSIPEKVAPTIAPPVSTPIAPPEQFPLPQTPSVLNEVTPAVPEKIQSKIQGRVYVTVRVLVDPSGNVRGALMESEGPSKYFARLSDQAARQWQFVSAETDADRVWLLRFEYTRNGVSVRTFEQ